MSGDSLRDQVIARGAPEADLGLAPVEDDGRVIEDGRHPVQDPALEH